SPRRGLRIEADWRGCCEQAGAVCQRLDHLHRNDAAIITGTEIKPLQYSGAGRGKNTWIGNDYLCLFAASRENHAGRAVQITERRGAVIKHYAEQTRICERDGSA